VLRSALRAPAGLPPADQTKRIGLGQADEGRYIGTAATQHIFYIFDALIRPSGHEGGGLGISPAAHQTHAEAGRKRPSGSALRH
jgi:hypothetical protein